MGHGRLKVARRRTARSGALLHQGIRLTMSLVVLAAASLLGSAATAHAGVTVVSVGDSYSSGEGTAPYDADTDRRDLGHKCHRSSGAWPRLAGATAGTHLACSGAVVANVNGKSGQTTRGADAQAQLPRLVALRNAGTIDYATITLGGNDLGFADKLQFCYLWGNVRGCLKDRDALKRSLASLRPKLAGVYRDVNMATRGGTTLVVGYPDIFPSPERGDRCVWLTKAMKENIEWFSGQLDATVSAAARDAAVSFLSVRDAFDAHELCTGKSWVRTLGGKPGDVTGDQQQGHPLKEGQSAIAAKVLRWMKNHPRPNGAVPTVPTPELPSSGPDDEGTGSAPPVVVPGGSVAETAGGVTHTWTNPANAGGTEGPTIQGGQTVGIACKLQGFRVANGNTWWYKIASSPWSGAYYASADAFYNNGQVSGSLAGTPWVDPAVPDCAAPAPPAAQTWAETTGGVAHTWTNYANAGGTEGPTIGANQTVQIACKLTGFRVADGNTWWYRIASSPWNGAYYVSADAFYNNGQTSGSLHGTPFVDPSIRDC